MNDLNVDIYRKYVHFDLQYIKLKTTGLKEKFENKYFLTFLRSNRKQT